MSKINNNTLIKNNLGGLIKHLISATIIDVATFSPELINIIFNLEPSSKALCEEMWNIELILDDITNTKSRQSCVLNLIENNHEVASTIVNYLSHKIGFTPLKEETIEKKLAYKGLDPIFARIPINDLSPKYFSAIRLFQKCDKISFKVFLEERYKDDLAFGKIINKHYKTLDASISHVTSSIQTTIFLWSAVYKMQLPIKQGSISLAMMPPEIIEHIASFLDANSILQACIPKPKQSIFSFDLLNHAAQKSSIFCEMFAKKTQNLLQALPFYNANIDDELPEIDVPAQVLVPYQTANDMSIQGNIDDCSDTIYNTDLDDIPPQIDAPNPESGHDLIATDTSIQGNSHDSLDTTLS